METQDWSQQLRDQFLVTRKTTFLDIAYENCGSEFAHNAINKFFEDWADVSPEILKAGGGGKGKVYETVEETRHLVARFIGGVDPGCIAFTKNTNEGINAILQGFDWKPGENVVTDDQEHPSVILPCLNLQNRGIECRIAEAKDGVSITPELLFSKVNENTRMIAVSHVQSCSGYKTDLQRLSAMCKERNIFLVVDAIQSLGFCVVDAVKWGLDAVSTACYKGLLGMSGSGFLYCAPNLLKRITPVYAAMNPCATTEKDPWRISYSLDADARKLENSTINFTGIYVLHEGLNRISNIGIDNIQKHISELFEKLYKGLAELGFSIVTPFEPEFRCHSISISTENPQSLYQHFMNNGVFLSLSAGKYVRMSIAPFTSKEDINKALQVAAMWKNS